MKTTHKDKFKKFNIIIVVAVLLIQQVLVLTPVNAQNPSLWISSSNPSYSVETFPANHISLINGAQCVDKEFITVKSPSGYKFGSGYSENQCAITTQFGTVGTDGLLEVPYSQGSGQMNFDRSDVWPVIIPNSKRLAYTTFPANSWSFRELYFYDDASTLFNNVPIAADRFKYVAKRAPEQVLKHTNGNKLMVGEYGISANGKWLVTRVHYGPLVRINLETLQITAFSSDFSDYNYIGTVFLGISNDGRYVSASSNGNYGKPKQHKIYDLETCSAPNPTNNAEVVAGCGAKDISDFLELNTGVRFGRDPQFNSDATQLSLTVPNNQRITLTAAGHEASQLDYLALGDSYSSGEGDLDGVSHYLHGTDGDGKAEEGIDVSKEKCHISDRSYPFLLAQQMGISNNKFKSVACSGAISEDILNKADSYKGHFEQLSKQLSQTQKDAIKNNFIPGRIAQIELVEKYKPKIMTISIGGNDVKFSDKIQACVSNIRFGTPTNPVCKSASNAVQRAADGNELTLLYSKLRKLYSTLHSASPSSKIFVLGYPNFVKTEALSCRANVNLNAPELEYVSQGVNYINSIIKAAAESAGAEYIDIQESLFGHELCAGQHKLGVNGLSFGKDLGMGSVKFISSASYHPNELGHKKIAETIRNSTGNLLHKDICPSTLQQNDVWCPANVPMPEVPEYFRYPAGQTPSFTQFFFAPLKIFARNETKKLNVNFGQLKPGSSASFELHSDPIALGDQVVNEEGLVNAELNLPESAPLGYHMLHIYATTVTGELVDLYQPVVITGPEGDIDDDGTADNVDPCPFVQPANVDYDQDGTDDACDGLIGEPPLYRVRNGDIAKGEIATQMYIERNVTEAERQLQITGDYDPDADGWAVVGHSNNNDTNGTPANFWVDDQNVPHASTRNPNKGCVQLKPLNLEKVNQGQDRFLAVEAENTNTCRKERRAADVDNNNIPDSQQVLYRARNGDPSVGEDANKIYMERNVVAAEAQLGLSDYDADNNGWAIVGRSDSADTNGIYKNLGLNQGSPFVSVQHATDGCLPIIANSLEVIRQIDVRGLSRTSGITPVCTT